jgi:3-oxoacyl-[acyl-carrier protein] reductase
VALVTGGSRGIGKGIVLELASLGWDLVINYNQNAEAAEVTSAAARQFASSEGKAIRTETCRADVSQSKDREALVDFARTKFGRVDLLVNNAGVAPNVRADLLEADEASFDRLININVKGPYFLTQKIARWMIEQSKAGAYNRREQPKIVTVSSVSAYTASTNRGDYCISKAALSMLTPLYASRLAEYGINVYEIRPGVIATDMTGPVKEKYDKLISEGLTPIARWGEPADVGRAVAAIAQNLLPFSTGEVLNVDGGFHLRRL